MRRDYSAPANPLKLLALNNLMAKPNRGARSAAADGVLLATANAKPAPVHSTIIAVARSHPASGFEPYTPHLPASVLGTEPAADEYGAQEPQPHATHTGSDSGDSTQ